MPINLGDLNKKNKEREDEEFKNQFRQLNGLYISNDSYENTAKRLRQMTDEKDRKAKEQAQYEYERDNASFFDRFLNTIGDVATDVGQGFLGTLEGIADWGTYRLADLSDLVGQEQWAKDLRGNADFNSTGALFGKNENVQENLFNKGWTDSIEKYSYSPELVDTIFQGVGNIGALAATAAVTGGGSLATIGASYTSAYGNARSEAKRNGASDRDANRAGIINGIAEALSEQFFEGMPGLSVEGWGSKFTGKMADKVQKYFGTTAGKIALKTLDAAGEGTEEIISNALVAVGNDLMHYYDSNYTYGMENQSGDLLQDFLDQWTNSDSWNQFLSASLTSAFLGSAKAVIDTGTQNKIINAYAKDNSISFKDAKYILTGQLESAKQELQRDKAEYDSNVELEDMAKKRVLNYMQNTTGANIESQIDQKIREEEQNLGTKFTDEQREKMRTEIRSMYEDRINSQNRYQEFTLEKEPTDEREKGLYESFKQNNRNNTKETHEIYKFIKTLQDNNPTSKYRLTSNEELAKMGELQKVEQDGKVKYLKDGKEVSINGFKKGDTIYINADAVNPYQATIGHEIGEAIKASDKQAYDSLKQLVKQVYGEGNLDDYKQIYGENLTDNVEDEYVNDKLGEMFKDNKLIDRISGDRNLLQRFIDEVKRLLQYITSKGEKKQLLKLQKSLQDKYIELYKEADFNKGNENASFSLDTDTDTSYQSSQYDKAWGRNITADKFMTDDRKIYDNLKTQTEALEQLERVKGNPNAEITIYRATPSESINTGDWVFLDKASAERLTKSMFSNIPKPGYRVVEEKVKAKDVDWTGKNLEFVYSPEGKRSVSYSLSQDSQGRELSKEQQEYFKDSKVRDDNGNLKVLYHGSDTAGFYTFGPTNQGNYKYGDFDESITFLTDSKDVAQSYTKSSEMVDTRKLESVADAKSWLKGITEDLYIEGNSVYDIDGEQILNYESSEDLLRNLKQDIQKEIGDTEAGGMYAVYANITNPYVVDVEGNEWDRIPVGDTTELKRQIKEKWDIPERQLDKLEGETLKELNKDITQLGYQLRTDEYGDLGLYTKSGQLAIDMVNVNDVMQEIRVDLNNDSNVPLSTNDIVFRVLAENKAGANYDGVIFKNISDIGQYGVGEQTSDVYVAFNSNQIKGADNVNPTEDSDIRYQLTQNQNQQTGFEGTQTIKDYTDYIDSLNTYNLPTNVDIEDEESYGVLTKEDYKNKKKELYKNYVDRAASKIDEQVKAVAKRNLELKSKDIADLKAITDKYTDMSREDIYNSDAKQEIRNFVEEHSHQEYEEQLINDEIQSLQKDIRSREFIISNEYKGEFPDGITQFKKNNPGIKIKFGQKGNLDTQLQELAELYPGQVKADVSYGDMPYVLADIMKQNAKTTKMQEFNLTEKEIDDITNKMFYGLTNNAISEKDLDRFVTTIQDKIRNKYARQMAIKEYRQQAKDLLNKIGLENIKDKKRGLLYQINTMKRNLRDIMSQENAQEMYDTYFKPISLHNAQIETDISDYNARIQKYNLNDKESTYTQMLGELKYNPETSLTEAQVNEYLTKNKNKIDTKKVNSAIEEFRGIYDELLGRINEALEANGYKPIDYRKGYFPHFIEDKASSMLGKFAEKLGFEVKSGQLPTDIAGITEEFQPGKVWTSFSQQRTGDATDYNALKGMDNYLRGAMDVIYHTQDIQRLRALEAEIRYQYSEKGVQEKLDEIFKNQDLSNEEKYAQAAEITDNVKNNPLGNFATELRNYTNNLANKKSISDRGMEQTMGRDMYSIMNNISGRVSANMVGANISSAMTNFIPITQAWSQVKTKNMLRGIYDTIKASIRDDGFTENSVYLTNRTQQADRLFKTKGQKATDVLGKPFEAIDSFTSNVIVRAKYYQNLEQGMNQVEAMDNADEFAKDVMAGRSKGDSPTMFNKKNPISKLFTAFQLEVNNQYGYMFKDIKADLGKEAKDKIAMAFMKMFIGAWLYNAITEKITGRKAAFSPIDMAIDDAKIITNENMDLATKIQNLTKSAAQEAPFLGGVLGGGRLPIQGAIPYDDPLSMVLETGQNLGALMDDEKRDAAINSLKKEWLKPVYYVALPVAGGQIKKTNEGLAMYNHKLPGSYTDSGKLRFEADTSPLGMLQAAVFGQYASENAREYFDEGYSPLTEKQVNEAMDANLPIAEYREINKGITQAKKEAKKNGESQSEAQYDYIYNLPISMEQKNSLLNSKLGTSDNVTDDNGYVKYTDGSKVYWYDEDNDVVYNSKYREMDNIDIESLTKYTNKKDLTDYGNYGSLDEFNYATKNPTKYAISQQISSYDNYVKYKDDIAAIKDNYNDNTKEGQKKAQQEVFKYINSLPMNQYQKLMLQKMAGGYSIKNYEQAIFNYINNLDLTKEEKQNIHKELFG